MFNIGDQVVVTKYKKLGKIVAINDNEVVVKLQGKEAKKLNLTLRDITAFRERKGHYNKYSKIDGDVRLNCSDCGSMFIFSEGEQRFYQKKSLAVPRLCPECKQKQRKEKEESNKPHRTVKENKIDPFRYRTPYPKN